MRPAKADNLDHGRGQEKFRTTHFDKNRLRGSERGTVSCPIRYLNNSENLGVSIPESYQFQKYRMAISCVLIVTSGLVLL
jgi:hypothetical protein